MATAFVADSCYENQKSRLAVLNPSDILEGARTADPRVFVVGAFDNRITFFSQQVRGLELAHALKDQGHLQPNMQVAVVGGGAAGVAAASALALLEDVEVDLFESANDVMMLQGASNHRRLDPHIYDWPAHNTADVVASLPILDWQSGSARNVCEQVRTEFNAIKAVTGNRIRVRTRHTVGAAWSENGAVKLRWRDADAAADEQKAFGLVVLAFGFGVEPVGGAFPQTSYWDDAGIPGPEFMARPQPRFLISGDGDGALIDLVAAANRDFSHAAMIQTVVSQVGLEDLLPKVLDIDREGRAAAGRGEPFDYFAAYDDQLFDDLRQTGLTERLAQNLRPGVSLTWQTLTEQPFNAKTATLNRLTAYLTIKALGDRFERLHGPLETIAPRAAGGADLPHWFRCGTVEFGVHKAIIRHGPDRAAVRSRFDNLLGTYAADHADWLRRFGDDVLVPRLSDLAGRVIGRAATGAKVPQPVWRTEELGEALLLRLAIQQDGNRLVWSGDRTIAACVDLWASPGPRAILYVPVAPQTMPQSAAALVRLCAHAVGVEMKGDSGLWRAYAEALTSESPHGQDMATPQISAGAPIGVGQNISRLSDADMAAAIHEALDGRVLADIDQILTRYLRTGADPGNQITVRAHASLLAAMRPIWEDWRGQFEGNPGLRSRFLRLMVCAKDTADTTPEALLLIGPRKLVGLVRSAAIALMVAAGWSQTRPAGAAPGNISVTRGVGQVSGHACGAEMIDRRPMALQAGRFMWSTDLVILPLVESRIEVRRRAEASMTETGGSMSLRDAGVPPFMVTTNEGFRDAAEAGLESLREYLADSEKQHFAILQKAVAVVE